MRIVFMGTPDYSVKTLEALINAGHSVEAVFAQPDKPVGRKQILTPPAVKVYANEKGIKVYQPNTLRDGTAYEIIKKINPDVIVVVAYGKILPKEILDFPKYGCVNGHASLLPRLRGASPIQWSIVSGDEYSGVTTMLMDEGMDTGDILEVKKVKIGERETAEQLFDRLSVISADLTVSTLEKLQKGEITPIKQNEDEATYAPIIKKDMAKLDFTKTAQENERAVRGFYSWPCAFFFIEGKRVKVIESRVSQNTDKKCGTVINNDGTLIIACGNSTSLELIKVQPEGSKAMSVSQWLCGHKIPLGTVAE
ncbi:MAG: methionyl-tRNA formyltransferase [Clostridia bacterium]|nr:methionyl-tRNA formyltransferase [Clostridia bacterium]